VEKKKKKVSRGKNRSNSSHKKKKEKELILKKKKKRSRYMGGQKGFVHIYREKRIRLGKPPKSLHLPRRERGKKNCNKGCH